jgi:hypothetical protein
VEISPDAENFQGSALEEIKVVAYAWLPLFYLLSHFVLKIEQATFDRGAG